MADDMKENLQYYAYLEPMTRRLNAPGAGNLVRSHDFPEMLSNLDSCLDYMDGHVSLPRLYSYTLTYSKFSPSNAKQPRIVRATDFSSRAL